MKKGKTVLLGNLDAETGRDPRVLVTREKKV